ncbi:MAG: hypothetical protein P1U56_17025 [Saprospiraceae bacterium]|nr:hypothetical protein [Saprospiraceae bacterium]
MRHELDILQLTTTRKILGVVILVVTALSYYSLFNIMRESIRYFSETEDYDLWVLSEIEVWFYNTIYACIAITLGIANAFQFIINRPLRISRFGTIRSSILNDQRVLNWTFIMWASKLGYIVGLFFAIYSVFYEFSLFPDYCILFVLFVLALHLQVWTHILRYFKLPILKTQLLGFLFLIISGLGLGTINLIDYKMFNARVLKKNIAYNYELIKPTSEIWEYNTRFSRTITTYLVNKKEQDNDQPFLIIDNKTISPPDLKAIVQKRQRIIASTLKNSLRLHLNINQSISMDVVNDIIVQAVQTGIKYVDYAVLPSEKEVSRSMQKYAVIRVRMLDYTRNPSLDSLINEELQIITLDVAKNQILINGVATADILFSIELKEKIVQTPNYYLRLSYEEDISYQRFIAIYSRIRQTISTMRDEYGQANYGSNYDRCEPDQRKQIQNIYPLYLEDMTYRSKFETFKNNPTNE